MQIANLLVDLSITTAAIYDMLLQLSVSKTCNFAVSVPVVRRAGVEPAIIIMAYLFTVKIAVSELVSSHFLWMTHYRFATAVY